VNTTVSCGRSLHDIRWGGMFFLWLSGCVRCLSVPLVPGMTATLAWRHVVALHGNVSVLSRLVHALYDAYINLVQHTVFGWTHRVCVCDVYFCTLSHALFWPGARVSASGAGWAARMHEETNRRPQRTNMRSIDNNCICTHQCRVEAITVFHP